MPKTEVVFFKEDDGSVPARDWLVNAVGRQNPAALAKCQAALELLRDYGRELRRPYVDYLRDGIYELRVRLGSVNYRMLFFWRGPVAAVVAHGITKEREVPDREIDRAVKRKAVFEAKPEAHYAEEKDDN